MWVTLLTSKVVVVRVEVTQKKAQNEKKHRTLGMKTEWKCNFLQNCMKREKVSNFVDFIFLF